MYHGLKVRHGILCLETIEELRDSRQDFWFLSLRKNRCKVDVSSRLVNI
jgi:hypothetical protein